jgi:hypothetical protein
MTLSASGYFPGRRASRPDGLLPSFLLISDDLQKCLRRLASLEDMGLQTAL